MTAAPNRLLDLDELEEPEARALQERMDQILGREPQAYLQPSKRWEYKWALERADLKPGARVLDIGSGGSVFPLVLRDLGLHVNAIDYWRYPRLGRATGTRPHYVKGDATMLPFRDSAFDAVFCISVIEHLHDSAVPGVLDEVRRVLRPGVRLLLTTDFYEDATAQLWFEDERGRQPVEWEIFDEDRLRRRILGHPGLELEGQLDLTADWYATARRMRRFHGYPYTSVGTALRNVPSP